MKSTFWIAAGLLVSGAALSLAGPASAQVQTRPDPQTRTQTRTQAPPIRQTILPDENTQARLVWSTLTALDNANRTGNYAVLYRLGTDAFQQQNSPARLSQLFSSLRENRVDVGRTILSSPTYYQPPAILADGSLRLRGGFDFRPKSIRFDLIYANEGGGWQLGALSVVEMDFDSPR
jgi:hypothetical protein